MEKVILKTEAGDNNTVCGYVDHNDNVIIEIADTFGQLKENMVGLILDIEGTQLTVDDFTVQPIEVE